MLQKDLLLAVSSNLIIVAFFVFLIFLVIPALLVTAYITFYPSASFCSFLGFWIPVTIMQDLQEYVSASSS